DGVWRETGIVAALPPGGPKVLWRAPTDPGYSGPAVAGGRVYVTDRQAAQKVELPDRAMPREDIPGTERVRCLDARTGQALWEHRSDGPSRIGSPSGRRATPLVAGGQVYTLGAMGDLRRLDAATGRLVWARNFRQDYKLRPPAWGWAAAPLLDGDRLICLVGGEGSAVVAFHKDTGQELWRAAGAGGDRHAPPPAPHARGPRDTP